MIKKIIITLLLLLSLGGNAFAENKPELSCKSAVLIDMESGRVLYDYNKDIELPQASITKLMTYLVFKDYLRYSQISESYETNMGDIKKWNLPSDGSVSGIKSGEIVTISQLFDALLIASGNDSAMMLQDVYNTSGRDMIADMNSKAKELGLTKSKYVNVSGLTMEWESGKIYNVTTAYETAFLGKKVIETYPEILKITSNKYFQHNNIKKNSTDDLLLDKELNVDGLKTGHTGEAGYCVISTAEISKNPEEKPFRLISVVLGSPTKNSRFDDSKRLLEYGRDNYSYVKLLKEINPENTQFKLKTEYYKGGEISGSIPDDAYILKGKEETIQYEVVFDRELPSKINKGDKIGKIIITGSDDRKVEFNLLASEEFKSVSFFKKVVIYFKHLLKF